MRADRTAEYIALTEEVTNDDSADRRTLARWRREYRQIEKRDHFASDGGDRARLAIDATAAALVSTERSASTT